MRWLWLLLLVPSLAWAGNSNPLVVTQDKDGPVKTYLVQHLTSTGVSGGTDDATGDYSGGQEIFYIQPPAGTVYRIARLLVFVRDSKVNADDYGAITSGLSTGIGVRTQDDSGTLIDLVDGDKVQTSAEWAHHCYDATALAWGAGNEFLTVRWTFAKSGTVLRLDGDQNERLEVTLDDDMTGLLAHQFLVQGYVE